MKETIWWGICRGIWKRLKDKSSVRGRLAFIDFLHHLAGIKINCSHLMKTLSCSGCPWLPLPGTEKSTGGPGSHHHLHNGTRLRWDHQCHPRQHITVTGAHCIQRHIGVNPLELRPRGPLGRADLKERYWCVIELWMYAGPWSQADLLAMGSREYDEDLEKVTANCSDRLMLWLGHWEEFQEVWVWFLPLFHDLVGVTALRLSWVTRT